MLMSLACHAPAYSEYTSSLSQPALNTLISNSQTKGKTNSDQALSSVTPSSPTIVDQDKLSSKDIDETTGIGVENFTDSFFSSGSFDTGTFASSDTETVDRDFIDSKRKDSIMQRLGLVQGVKPYGVVPYGRIIQTYTDNLLSTIHNKKDDHITDLRYSLLAWRTSPANSYTFKYDGDLFYYANFPKFNRVGNEFKTNAKLFRNKKLRVNLLDVFRPTSKSPGGTEQLAYVAWQVENNATASLVYDITPKTAFELTFNQKVLNRNTTKEVRLFNKLSNTISPSVYYKMTPLTTFNIKYDLTSADYFNDPTNDYKSHTFNFSMQTKLTHNTYTEARIGYMSRLFKSEFLKDFNGFIFGIDYKLQPGQGTVFKLSLIKGIQDSNLDSSSPYSSFSKFSAELNQKLFVPNFEVGILSFFKRNIKPNESNGKNIYFTDNYSVGSFVEYNIEEKIFFALKHEFIIYGNNYSESLNRENQIIFEGRLAY